MVRLKKELTHEERAALPPHYQECYTLNPQTGKYDVDLDLPPGWAVEDVAGLKATLQKERENASVADAIKKKFEGHDLNKVLEINERYKDANKWTPTEAFQQQLDMQVRQVDEKYVAKLAEKDKELSFLTSEVERVLIDAEVARAVERRKDNPNAGSFALLIGKVRQHARVGKGLDNKFRTTVVDENGTTRVTGASGSMNPMSIAEYIGTLKNDPEYARAFDGPQAAGSGGAGSPQISRNGQQGADLSGLPPEKRMAEFRRMQGAS